MGHYTSWYRLANALGSLSTIHELMYTNCFFLWFVCCLLLMGGGVMDLYHRLYIHHRIWTTPDRVVARGVATGECPGPHHNQCYNCSGPEPMPSETRFCAKYPSSSKGTTISQVGVVCTSLMSCTGHVPAVALLATAPGSDWKNVVRQTEHSRH